MRSGGKVSGPHNLWPRQELAASHVYTMQVALLLRSGRNLTLSRGHTAQSVLCLLRSLRYYALLVCALAATAAGLER